MAMRALRPFLLRRTEEAVLPELPPKTEQTLICELKRDERRAYDELLTYYRASLAAQVKEMGWTRVSAGTS